MNTLPQIIWLALTLSGLLLIANQHGKPSKPTNFWTSFAATVLVFLLLLWGGFFNQLFGL
jgi:hypothetical protein